MADVRQGLQMRDFWLTFGANEIKSKYRRSKLGQFWITLSVGVFIFVIGGLYKGLLNISDSNYFAYLATGYILWQYINDTINQGCIVISRSQRFLMQRYYPISVFALQLIYREILTTAHHVILLPLVFVIIHYLPSPANLMISLIGFALVVYSSFWLALILGIISLRVRDLPPIIQSLMRVAFYATPVIWVDKNLEGFSKIIATLNPFKYYIAIVRDPLIGNTIHLSDWVVCVVISIVLTIVSLITLALTKKYITFWL